MQFVWTSFQLWNCNLSPSHLLPWMNEFYFFCFRNRDPRFVLITRCHIFQQQKNYEWLGCSVSRIRKYQWHDYLNCLNYLSGISYVNSACNLFNKLYHVIFHFKRWGAGHTVFNWVYKLMHHSVYCESGCASNSVYGESKCFSFLYSY